MTSEKIFPVTQTHAKPKEAMPIMRQAPANAERIHKGVEVSEMSIYSQIDVLDLIKKPMDVIVDGEEYHVLPAYPAIGIIYIINNFISGHVRLRGRPNGAYPYKYLDMIDTLFGKAENTLEVCSADMKGNKTVTTVDISNENADVIWNAEDLGCFPAESFERWRADPPYNEDTAYRMYMCKMPSLSKLLKAGARVVKPGSLLFLLCAQNYQVCPPELKRIGLITISVVPNNELRALNIYIKL